MKRLFLISIVGLFSFLLQSCFEDSTVINIKKDGSGTILKRSFSNMSDDGPLGDMSELTGGEINGPGVAPTEEMLQEVAEDYGKGVVFQSIKEVKNKAGWDGFESLYTFKDITQLRLHSDASLSAEMIQESGIGPDDSDYITFTKQGDEITVHIPFVPAKNNEQVKGKQKKAKKQKGKKKGNLKKDKKPKENKSKEGDDFQAGAEMMAMMGPAFKDSKMGVFLKFESGIAGTNALFQQGNMITLMNFDLGTVFSNEKSLKKMETIDNAKTREEAQKIANSIEGIKADMQEKIQVKMK